MKLGLFSVLFAFLTIGASLDLMAAPAAGSSNSTTTPTEASNRQTTKLGAYFGVLGDPAPTLVGINAAYNMADYLRLHAGYGQIKVTSSLSSNGTTLASSETTMTTLGLGALAAVPGWNITPVAGLSYSHVFISGDGDFNYAPNNVYTTIGADWQAASGFNVGVGYNLALTQKSFGNAYLNLGYFFM